VRAIVTGNRGKIGAFVERRLVEDGWEIAGFDLEDGRDVTDPDAVRSAARGCDAAVHLGAIPNDRLAPPEEIMRVNVLGIWHVLLAAREEGLRHVVFFSSGQVLGVAQGHGVPDYLPFGDEYPARGTRPYALSKRVGEELCAATTAETGIATVCLRPVGVIGPGDYERRRALWREHPESEWTPYWEYGAYVDVRDVAEAVVLALGVAGAQHDRMLLAADDIAATRPTREMASMLHPQVEWRGGEEYESDPWRSLVRTDRARDVLGWRPRYCWRDAA
jgi:nucleoside-diphosphate-sugar epimerase